MRNWSVIAQGVCLTGCLVSFREMGAQEEDSVHWKGTLDQWEQTASLWQLNAPQAGNAWLYACMNTAWIPHDSLGRKARVRWSQSYAGSNNNFSRLHFFTPHASDSAALLPIPISNWTANSDSLATGSFIHLGTTGTEDPLDWRRVSDPMASGESFPLIQSTLPGSYSEGMDAWFEWTQLPGDSLATITVESTLTNTPPLPIFTAVHPFPTCIGISTQFTISNIDAIEFELDQFSMFVPDTVAPKLEGCSWPGDSLVSWHFSESVRPGLGTISSAIGQPMEIQQNQTSSKTIHMPFDTHWIPGIERTFLLQHFTDQDGNMLSDTTVQVLWTSPNTANRGDVVLTEIMADPTPHDDLPPCEWVEVLNRSNRTFDVQFWNWWDEGSSEVIPIKPRPPWDGILLPGERFLISGCSTSILNGGALEAHIQGAPAFNDSQDGLGILRNDGMVLDAVHYQQSWWQGDNGGVSLQVLKPGACASPVNWIRSNAMDGCTPGTPSNQETALGVESEQLVIERIVPTSILDGFIEFDSPLDPLSEVQISPRESATWHTEDHFPNRLFWNHRITRPDQRVRFEIDRLKRCESDWSTGSRFAFKVDFEMERFPEPGDLIISEIAANPRGSSAVWGEFIELYNRHGTDAIELGGLQCGDLTIDERSVLRPGERRVVYPGALPNEKGTVTLRNGKGIVLDEVHYSACWHAHRKNAESGFSLVRVDIHGPAQNNKNWASSGHALGASPGETDPNEHMGSWLDGQTLDVFDGAFLLHGQTSSDTYFLFSKPVQLDTTLFRVVGQQEPIDWFHSADANRIWAQSALLPIPDSICAMDVHGRIEWLKTRPFDVNLNEENTSMHLNEVLDADAFGEPFIELENINATALGTADWLVSTETLPFPDDWIALSPGINWQIPPNEPWAFSACPNRLLTPRAITTSLPSLYGRNQIHLKSPEHVIETVPLNTELHAPWASPRKTSLERLQSTANAQWKSSAAVSGSTPGAQNSWSIWGATAHQTRLPSLEIIQSTWLAMSHSQQPRSVIFALHPGEDETVWQAHICVLSASGRIIWRVPQSPWIAPNQSAWTGAWDGRNEHGILAAAGNYLLQVIFEEVETGRRIPTVAPVYMAPAQ